MSQAEQGIAVTSAVTPAPAPVVAVLDVVSSRSALGRRAKPLPVSQVELGKEGVPSSLVESSKASAPVAPAEFDKAGVSSSQVEVAEPSAPHCRVWADGADVVRAKLLREPCGPGSAQSDC